MTAAVLLAGLLAAAATHDAAARPAEPPERPARFTTVGRYLAVSFAFPDVFDKALAARLDSGFAMNLVVRAWLFKEGAARPESLAVRSFRVAYDLWDEVYLVEERDDAGVRTFRERTQRDAIARVTTVERLPLAEASWAPPGTRVLVRALVEVNPVSPETLAKVRRWLTRPTAGSRVAGEGDSFFGSFVSIFVNPRIGDAERTLRLRTQVVTVPAPSGGAP